MIRDLTEVEAYLFLHQVLGPGIDLQYDRDGRIFDHLVWRETIGEKRLRCIGMGQTWREAIKEAIDTEAENNNVSRNRAAEFLWQLRKAMRSRIEPGTP